MADLTAKLIPLYSEVEERVPTIEQLDVGELAYNIADRKIYTRNSADEIVLLGAGAGGGLPGGEFLPNLGVPETDLFRYIWSGINSNTPASGKIDGKFGGWDITVSLIDADGVDRTVAWTEMSSTGVLRIMDAQGTELWNAPVLNVDNINANRITINLAFPDVTFDTLSADDEVYLDLYETTQKPGDPIAEIPLRDGDILRYDGANWRPRQFTVAGLDDTSIPSSGFAEVRWEQRAIASIAGGLLPGLAYQDGDNNGLHPQATIEGELVDISEAFEAWIKAKTGIDVSANSSSGDWTFTPNWQTILNYDGTNYTVDVFRFRNRSTASSSYDPRFSLHYNKPSEVPNTDGGIMRFPEFEDFYYILNGGVNDGGGVEDNYVLQWDSGTLKWIGQKLDFELDDATNVALRVDTGSGTEIPKAVGDALLWDGSFWRPANPLAGQSISALDDVNTVTTPPTNGQALVWDEANGYWKPGTVASDAPEIALNDLTDVTITTAAEGQVLKFRSSVWVNEALVYADITDAPTVPVNLGDLADVDMSLAPVIGQALVWDGTAWTPTDQSGGGGGGESVAGALTERADVAVTENFGVSQQKDLEFAGMGEAGKFVQVTISQPAWIRFYATAADRSADATRSVDDDPQPGSGVLMEVRTQVASEVVKITPGAIYYNNDLLPTQALYARVQNQSGLNTAITITVRAYTSTDTDTIDGGTFGSG